MKRRRLLSTALPALAGILPACRQEKSSPATFRAPVFRTLAECAEDVRTGRTTPEALVRHYTRLADLLDKAGPCIHAILELNPQALEVCQELRRESARSPLHGVPILIKDNIDTADAMQTTAGSLALLGGRKPAQDAFIVSRLRTAGMVLLGKTNLSEWANIRSPGSTSGWSARGGLTVNPHHLAHSASGSSSGSAAAVAAGLSPAAIGTETNGSIISPASACGLVGLKPTVGRVSRSGIIPITQWQDTAGPMTLTVKDAALLMNVLSGVDEEDPHTLGGRAHNGEDHTAGLTPEALRGKRVGVVREMCGSNPQVNAVFETALNVVRNAGAIIVDNVQIPGQRKAATLAWTAMLTELRQDLNAYLATRNAGVRSLREVMDFNVAHAKEELKHFEQEFFEEAERRGTPEAIQQAREFRAMARQLAGPEGIGKALESYKVDVLVCATNDPVHRIDLAHGDDHSRCACGPSAVAGWPHVTVPMGTVGALPVGISFFGAAWSEPLLLACGHAFELLMPARPTPRFLSASV